MALEITKILDENIFFQNIPNIYIKNLVKLHITNYHNTYNINLKESKSSFLAKYGKGNEKRKLLIAKNIKIMKDPSTPSLVANYLELINSILKLIANQKKNKLGLLLVSVYFIYKKSIKSMYENHFTPDPLIQKSLNMLFEYMDFYSFTYFSKNSIVNSLELVLHGILKTYTNCKETEIAIFLTYIQNSLFEKTQMPTKVRADYMKKYNPYVVGVYNSLPIFQLYTGANKNYYNNQDLLKIKKFLNENFLDKDVYEKITEVSTNTQLSNLHEILRNKSLLSKLINNLHIHYAKNPFLDEKSEIYFLFPLYFNFKKYPILSHKYVLNVALSSSK